MTDLYMHSLRLNVRQLMKLGAGIRMRTDELDVDYLVHSAIAQAFGERAPKPFSLSEIYRDGNIRLLGYSGASKEELIQSADAALDPELHECFDWNRFASKKMPDVFADGSRFSFSLRTPPLVSRRTPNAKRGKVVDAFLAACGPRPDPELDRSVRHSGRELERAAVYQEWLTKRTEGGGFALEQSSIDNYRRRRVFRRTQGPDRKGRAVEIPDVTFEGVLRVTDPEAFRETLAKGIGRHKAFGFGMLLLKPAR